MSKTKPHQSEARRGWSGSSTPDFAAFDFAEVPWSEFDRQGMANGAIRCAKASDSRLVLRLQLDQDPKLMPGVNSRIVVYAKRYLVNSLRRKIGNLLGGSKAQHEFELGNAMIAIGLPTPEPLAWAYHSQSQMINSRRLPAASYLLTRIFPNAGSAKLWLEKRPETIEELTPLMATFIAHSHESGFYHDDCSAEHLLISREAAPGALDQFCVRGLGGENAKPPLFSWIDLDNGGLEDRPVGLDRRALNLFQILRSLDLSCMSRELRREFVAKYCAGCAEGSVRYREGTTISSDTLIPRIEKIARRKVNRPVI